ncbi:MAG: DUF6175 family protein [Bacteroides stercoris]
MRIVVSFLSLFLPLYLLAQNGQARQPNVMVVPFVEPGEGENDRIKDAVLNDEAVPLALSKIKEEFNLRNFKTIDFMTEFQRSAEPCLCGLCIECQIYRIAGVCGWRTGGYICDGENFQRRFRRRSFQCHSFDGG